MMEPSRRTPHLLVEIPDHGSHDIDQFTEKEQIMMRLKLLASMLALTVCAMSALADHPVRYRLTQIAGPPDRFVLATDINARGEVVGALGGGSAPHGFYWHDGTFVDIHDQVNPAAEYVEASGTNDRGQISGIFIDPSVNAFRGFLLNRDGSLRVITGPAGADQVFVAGLNNRDQMWGLSYDVNGNETRFLWDRGVISILEPGFDPGIINERGVISGTAFFDGDVHAATWKNGEITVIGPAGTNGGHINERGQVTGVIRDGDIFRGILIDRGELTVLPALREDHLSYRAGDINNDGVIVGTTLVLEGEETQNIATLWDKDHKVADLNGLILPRDPLRPFVQLYFATLINDRGEIVADGRDLRTGLLTTYFLTPVRR